MHLVCMRALKSLRPEINIFMALGSYLLHYYLHNMHIDPSCHRVVVVLRFVGGVISCITGPILIVYP